MQKLKFSGHETFICKQLWPKKGFDFLSNGNSFTDDDAIVKLGVGKNMVVSIRFWMKSLGLTNDNDELSDVANLILDDNGFDPYLEDIGTIWLLHYFLVTTNYASLYHIVFNEFIKVKNEFTKNGLHNFIHRIALKRDAGSYNEKTVNNDISVLIRNYLPPEDDKKINIEEGYAGLFLELHLMKHLKEDEESKKVIDYYIFQRDEKKNLPKEIFLFAILTNENYGDSISLNELVSGNNSVGNVFLMNREGIYQKIEQLMDAYDFLSYSQTAGNPVLQISRKPDPLIILANYYEN
jgi:hypothetical protein